MNNSNIRNGECLHVVLYGTFKENRYFLGDYRDSFDLLGFNANIIAHAPQGIAAFVAQLKTKKFFIDPQTHAFQHDIKTITRRADGVRVVKESIRKLADEYGEPYSTQVGRSPLESGTLTDQQIKSVSENVLNFQWDTIHRSVMESDAGEFLDYDDIQLRPQFLIAPYCAIFADESETQIGENIALLSQSRQICQRAKDYRAIPLFGEIVLANKNNTDSILDDANLLDTVAKSYAESEAQGFILWVDRFAEDQATANELKNYITFLEKLGKSGKPIIALHGSYFSTMLSGPRQPLLAGVGHGMEYGESRSVVPVGGGVPLAKFYFPKFHKRVNYDPDATTVLLEQGWANSPAQYFDQVCSCNICQEIIQNDVQQGFKIFGETKQSEKNGKLYPTGKALDLSRRHYLTNKRDEYDSCRSCTNEQLQSELSEKAKMAQSVDKNTHDFSHIVRWKTALFGK